jgi:hypothetical protein
MQGRADVDPNFPYEESYEMNDKIEAAIIKLKADATGTLFTGFVTNALVVPPAMLTGEVWCHVLADGFGTFADGHRVETSDIVQVHSSGDSLWVSTRSGSDYGILSFAPLGWMYFADLYKAHQRLDPHPPSSPIWHMELPQVRAPGLAFERKGLVSQKTDLQAARKRKRKLLGPEENTKYMDRMSVFIDETIETFKRTGVNIPGTDNSPSEDSVTSCAHTLKELNNGQSD